jgi:predicted nucleic acid-binding Zn ribbon protein
MEDKEKEENVAAAATGLACPNCMREGRKRGRKRRFSFLWFLQLILYFSFSFLLSN